MAKRSARAAPLPAKWRRLAEERCAEQGARLTPARLAVYAEMLTSGRPLSAYELIALLEGRQERKIAPLTVYRHLDFLMRTGLVHRLESAQTYLACDHPDHAHESQFLLCSSCGHVDEVESNGLEALLAQIAGERGFRPDNAVVEVKGLCGACAVDEQDRGASPPA
ncbi:MAG: Fur family transcriptional regulator [Gammaproteobacteria bacterium]|nr:Fur family transcriptional regulator [Gammaproteobacteria bacterium]